MAAAPPPKPRCSGGWWLRQAGYIMYVFMWALAWNGQTVHEGWVQALSLNHFPCTGSLHLELLHSTLFKVVQQFSNLLTFVSSQLHILGLAEASSGLLWTCNSFPCYYHTPECLVKFLKAFWGMTMLCSTIGKCSASVTAPAYGKITVSENLSTTLSENLLYWVPMFSELLNRAGECATVKQVDDSVVLHINALILNIYWSEPMGNKPLYISGERSAERWAMRLPRLLWCHL